MTRRPKPMMHGRDHAPDGADPIPAAAGDGIQFDTDPQTGVYLWVQTTGTDPGTGRGINLMSDTAIQVDGSAVQVYAETDDVEINSVTHDVNIGATHNVLATAGHDLIWTADRDASVSSDRDATWAAHRDVTVQAAFGGAAGVDGNIILLHLPTSDPGVSGALWNSAGTLKISP